MSIDQQKLENYEQGKLDQLEEVLKELEELKKACSKVLEGFEKEVFIRDISQDANWNWAIRILPYISALGELNTLVRDFVPPEDKSWDKPNEYTEEGILKNMRVGDWIVTTSGEVREIISDDMNDLKAEDISRFATKREVEQWKDNLTEQHNMKEVIKAKIIKGLEPTEERGIEFYTKSQLELAMSIYANSQTQQLQEQVKNLEEALKKIRDWKLPKTGRFWDEAKTETMSYEAAHGTQGVQDYIRKIAQEALAESEYI